MRVWTGCVALNTFYSFLITFISFFKLIFGFSYKRTDQLYWFLYIFVATVNNCKTCIYTYLYTVMDLPFSFFLRILEQILFLIKAQSQETSTIAFCCLVLMANLSNFPVVLDSCCTHSLVDICFICFHSHWLCWCKKTEVEIVLSRKSLQNRLHALYYTGHIRHMWHAICHT